MRPAASEGTLVAHALGSSHGGGGEGWLVPTGQDVAGWRMSLTLGARWVVLTGLVTGACLTNLDGYQRESQDGGAAGENRKETGGSRGAGASAGVAGQNSGSGGMGASAGQGGGGVSGTGTGGMTSAGGTSDGGAPSSGGSIAGGGVTTSGGAVGTGGSSATGGVPPSTGGMSATGGLSGTGGSVTPGSCAFTFSVTTVTYNGKYGPSNVGAIWIEDASGTFVKTLREWGFIRQVNLIEWKAVSSGNEVDAITGATRTAEGATTGSWNCTNVSESRVPNGQYSICIEIAEDTYISAGPHPPYTCQSFVLGSTSANGSFPDQSPFVSMSWGLTASP